MADVRMGDLVQVHDPPHDATAQGSPKPQRRARLDIVGFASDAGVNRNGGRPGARGGPAAFRARLRRFGCVPNPETHIDVRENVDIYDRGDVATGETGSLEDAHAGLERMVCESLAAGAVPFVVGGGNDQSYPNVCALLASQRAAHHPIGVINIDAHLDVREPVAAGAHSGSPFRLMCEDARFAGSGSRFVEFACQGMQCSAEHARWVEHKGHSIMWLSEIEADPAAAFRTALDRIAGPDGKAPIFVSFDIDSIDSAHCPGVSCPAPVGLTARQACQIAFIAGADPRVALIDVSEFNPLIEEYRTGRLVAAIFTNFAEGLATRTMTAAALPQ